MRRFAAAAIAVSLGLAAAAVRAEPIARMSEDAVRSFVERQEKAWLAGDLDGYYEAFAADADFIVNAPDDAGKPTTQHATLAEDRQDSTSFRAAHPDYNATFEIASVALDGDGRSARVALVERASWIEDGQTAAHVDAIENTIVIRDGALKTKSFVETLEPAPPGAAP